MSLHAEVRSPDTFLCVAGEMFLPVAQGALWWPSERLLVVSDLHLEKGSNFASAGQLLPPYDTRATLTAVEALVDAFDPRTVVSLGDSFHDRQAEFRLGADAVSRIRRLTSRVEWFWVEGNHDPDPPAHLGGIGAISLVRGNIVFRHEPTGTYGEIAGHLHPVARIAGRGRSLRRKCFVTDGSSLVLPSLGAFTGGLNVLDRAFGPVFDGRFNAWLMGDAQVYPMPAARLVPDELEPARASSAAAYPRRSIAGRPRPGS